MKIISEKNWKDLQRYDWVKEMDGVPQSPVHHAEGDVAKHTQMVLHELERLPEYLAQNEQVREIIWVAALMHDIEKRSTTRVDENGNIISPGHSRKGAQTANLILYKDFSIPLSVRNQIVALVRYHGLPLWSMEKNDPAKEVIRASMEVNTEWLYILSKADVLGRICSDKRELMERLEFFKELCGDWGCWGNARSFPSELTMFSYFRKESQSPDFLPFDDTKTQAVMLSGLAGSGKDHYVQRHYKNTPVISLDALRREQKIDRLDSKGNGRIIQQALEQAKSYLRNQELFVWNATNITYQMRDQLIGLFSLYKPQITLVYVEVPYAKLIAQNRNREYPIPNTALEKMIAKLEVPKVWEAHEVTYVTH